MTTLCVDDLRRDLAARNPGATITEKWVMPEPDEWRIAIVARYPDGREVVELVLQR